MENLNKISLSRKISFTLIGIVIFLSGFLYFTTGCANGCYNLMAYEIMYALSPILLGVCVVILGYVRIQILWVICILSCSAIAIQIGKSIVGTGVEPGIILLSSLFIIFWILLIIALYIKLFTKPTSQEKEFKIFLLFLILPILSGIFAMYAGLTAQSETSAKYYKLVWMTPGSYEGTLK